MDIVLKLFNNKASAVLPDHNKDKYREFIQLQPGIPVFFQDWWLDIVCGSDGWQVALSFDKGGNITGVLPYVRNRLKTIPVHSNPPLSPFLGIRLFYPENPQSVPSRYSFELRTIEQLIGELPGNVVYRNFTCHPEFRNAYPFYWKNYLLSFRYTYILDDIQDTQLVYKGFTNTLRRQIQQATETIQTGESDDIRPLFGFIRTTLKRQGIHWKFTLEQMQSLYSKLKEKDQGKLLVAREHGNILASLLLVWDDRTAYCMALGMDGTGEPHNAVKLLLWESIKQAASRVEQYNFEGSMVPNVERVFRSFGGIRTEYYQLKWYKNRWLKALFALMNK